MRVGMVVVTGSARLSERAAAACEAAQWEPPQVVSSVAAAPPGAAVLVLDVAACSSEAEIAQVVNYAHRSPDTALVLAVPLANPKPELACVVSITQALQSEEPLKLLTGPELADTRAWLRAMHDASKRTLQLKQDVNHTFLLAWLDAVPERSYSIEAITLLLQLLEDAPDLTSVKAVAARRRGPTMDAARMRHHRAWTQIMKAGNVAVTTKTVLLMFRLFWFKYLMAHGYSRRAALDRLQLNQETFRKSLRGLGVTVTDIVSASEAQVYQAVCWVIAGGDRRSAWQKAMRKSA